MRDDALKPLTFPDGIWREERTRRILRDRDIGQLFHLARKYAGASQTRIANVTGMTQGQVSHIMSPGPQGNRQVTSIYVLERIAAGFCLPDEVRMLLGLAPQTRPSSAQRAGPTQRPEFPSVPASSQKPETSRLVPILEFASAQQGQSLIGAPQGIFNPDDIERLTKTIHEPRRADTHIAAYFQQLLNHYATASSPLWPLELIGAIAPAMETIDRFRKDAKPPVRQALLTIHTQYAQLTGRMYYEAGNHAQAVYWSDRAMNSAHQAEDDQLLAYVLLRRTSLAAEEHDPAQIIDLVQAAREKTPLPPAIASLAYRHEAEGHALTRDHNSTQRSLDHAIDLLTAATPADDLPYASGHSLTFLHLHIAHCYVTLGRFPDAIKIYQSELPNLANSRAKAFHLAKLAHAYTALKEHEQARSTTREALTTATETEANRAIQELAKLIPKLQ